MKDEAHREQLDRFAAAALTGLLVGVQHDFVGRDIHERLVDRAYDYARKMMAVRAVIHRVYDM